MSIRIVNRKFFQKYFKMYYPWKININFVSNSHIRCAKKKFSMKNKFTFRNQFPHNQAALMNSEQETVSPDRHSEQNEINLKYDELRDPDHKIVSADLLSRESITRERNIKLSSQAKTNKPSLTYQGEILYGVHPVYQALLQKKRNFHHLYTRKDIGSPEEDSLSLKAGIIQLAKSMDIPISYVDTRGLKILAPGAVHQGICLDAGFLPLPIWNEDLPMNDVAERNLLWLVLDEILDPMNVGAIIRSACYFGVKKLFTIRGNRGTFTLFLELYQGSHCYQVVPGQSP